MKLQTTELSQTNIIKLFGALSKTIFSLTDLVDGFKLFKVNILSNSLSFSGYMLSNFSPQTLLNSVLLLAQPDLNSDEKNYLLKLLDGLHREYQFVLYPSSAWSVKNLPDLIFAFSKVELFVASALPGRMMILERPEVDTLPIPVLVLLSRLIVVFKYRLSPELLAITELALDAGKEIFAFTGPCWDSQYSGNLTLIREGVVPLTGKSDLELYISK